MSKSNRVFVLTVAVEESAFGPALEKGTPVKVISDYVSVQVADDRTRPQFNGEPRTARWDHDSHILVMVPSLQPQRVLVLMDSQVEEVKPRKGLKAAVSA